MLSENPFTSFCEILHQPTNKQIDMGENTTPIADVIKQGHADIKKHENPPHSKPGPHWVTRFSDLQPSFSLCLSASFRIQANKLSSNFEEFTDSTFLPCYCRAPAMNNWLVESLALMSPFRTLLSRSPNMTQKALVCS